MAVSGVSGLAVAAAGTGALLVWSGIKGANMSKTLRSVLAGKQPAGADPGLAVAGNFTAGSSTSTSSTAGLAGSTPGAGSYDHAGLMALWQQAGGSAAAANNAACHGMQESSGRAGATSSNPDGGTNVGLWQLDTPGGKGAGYTVAQLKNPLTNARITVMATRNGADWSAWATPGC
jgi:hypothetical protein